jgi:cytochrome P450
LLKACGQNKPMKSYSEIPKDPIHQTWFHSLQFIKDAPLFLEQQRQKHGQVFRCRIFGFDIVRIQDADVTGTILKNSHEIVSAEKGWDVVLDDIFPNGLLSKDGKHHLFHRRIMQHAFKKEAMLAYFEEIKVWSEALASDLALKPSVDFFPYIKVQTLNLALKLFLGLDPSEAVSKSISKAFIDMVESTMALVRIPMLNSKFHRGVKGRAHLIDVFSSLVKQRRKQPRNDLVSFLCDSTDEDGNQFSDEQIIDHIIFTMMAAHDTTASSLSSLMLQITDNTHWQDKIAEEVSRFPNLSYGQLKDLTVSENVFKETLRIMPPVVTAPRVFFKDVNLLGYDIPAGTRTGINIYGNHHDPRYWNSPEKFDPTRFERGEDKNHPNIYIPFGGGAHKCIGMHVAMMEVKLILNAIFKQLRVERVDPSQPVIFKKVPIWHPKGKFELKFKSA